MGRRTARSSARDESGHDLEPVSIRSLIARLVLGALVAVVVVSLLTAHVSRNVAVDMAIDDATASTVRAVQRSIEPVLTDAVLTGDQTAIATLDSVVRSSVLSDAVISVKVWTADGTIAYSTDPRLIGEQFELDSHELELFKSGGAAADVSDLSAPENRYEPGEKLLEVYTSTSTVEGTPVLYEAYHSYDRVTSMGRQIATRLIPIAIGAIIVVELLQIPLVLRLARRLRSGQRRRERLISHALATSDAERRRIAEGLHLGALQELAGSTMSLAAAGIKDGDDPQLDAASAGIRESVRSLRSLLLDIAPPERAADLESSLSRLLDVVNDHGIATELAVTGATNDIGSATSALLYRTAQELVRDAARDGSATALRIELVSQADSIEMVVVDDRDRSTPSSFERTDPGVVAALGDLIADAGGQLTSGEGSMSGRWTRLQIPLLAISGGRRRSH
jgi:two-component system, NarL family, sensor kinase